MSRKRLDLLFRDVPKNNPQFIADSFVNRLEELSTASRFFNPSEPSDQIYAIHGFSRIGKSHLAMKIVHDITQEHKVIQFYVNANTKGTAFDILQTLYEQVSGYIRGWQDVEANQADLSFLASYLNDMNKLMFTNASKILMKETVKLSQKLSPKLRAKLPFLDIGFGWDRTQGEDKETVVEFTKPGPKEIRMILCLLLELMTAICKRTIVILVDDLDLLEEAASGEDERDALMNHLKLIAEIDKVAVFITSRQHYFIERQKEMYNYIQVPLMPEQSLKDIYAKRIALFHENEPVFEDAVLTQLAVGFEGMVGAFLYECYLLLRNFINAPLPLTLTHLQHHLIKELALFKANPETQIFLMDIEQAVKNGTREMVLPEMEKKHGFMYRVLIPKGYQQDTYDIMPLFAKAIRDADQ